MNHKALAVVDIRDLIHAGADPETVQYLAGHLNSRAAMDIYAKGIIGPKSFPMS